MLPVFQPERNWQITLIEKEPYGIIDSLYKVIRKPNQPKLLDKVTKWLHRSTEIHAECNSEYKSAFLIIHNMCEKNLTRREHATEHIFIFFQ